MSALSRFFKASRISKNPSQYSTSLTFDPISRHSSGLLFLLRSFLGLLFLVRHNITPTGPPFPSTQRSSSLRNWVVGIVLTFILPFVSHIWGPWIQLKNKVDKVKNSTEHVMEVIEKVARGADEIIDEITNELPQNSKLKESMEAIDEIVEGVAKAAHLANKIMKEVEETEEKLESFILDEVKEEEVSICRSSR